MSESHCAASVASVNCLFLLDVPCRLPSQCPARTPVEVSISQSADVRLGPQGQDQPRFVSACHDGSHSSDLL